MGICYLLHPFHLQLNSILHTFSHSMDSPNSVITHAVDPSGSVHGIHGYHDHDNYQVGHEHILIDFISAIFEASEDQNLSGEGPIPQIVVDKHISANPYKTKKVYRDKLPVTFFYNIWGIGNGYPEMPFKPPRSITL